MEIIKNIITHLDENPPVLPGVIKTLQPGFIEFLFSPLDPNDPLYDLYLRISMAITAPFLFIGLHIANIAEMTIRFIAEHLKEPLEYSKPLTYEEIAKKDPDNHLLIIPVELQHKIFQLLDIDDVFSLALISHDFRDTIFSRILSAYINAKKTSTSDLRLNTLQKKTWLQQQGHDVRYLGFRDDYERLFHAQHWLTLCPNLKELSIDNTSRKFFLHKSLEWEPIFTQLGKLKNFSHLCLLSCDLSSSESIQICSLNKLSHLDLSGSRNFKGIPEIIGNLTALKVLRLSNISSSTTIDDIEENLKKLELSKFSFSHNRLYAEGAARLVEAFRDNIYLTHLDINYTSIGRLGAEEIAKNLRGLTHLHISGNNIMSEGAIQIVNNLTNLTTLELSDSFSERGYLLPYNGINLNKVQRIIDGLLLLKNLSSLKFHYEKAELLDYSSSIDDVSESSEEEIANDFKSQLLLKFPNCILDM